MLVDKELRNQIKAAACGMNAACPSADKECLPNAEIVFDQFRVIQHLSGDVCREARQTQAKKAEAKYGKKSEEARKTRKLQRTAAWDLAMPEQALAPPIRERPEELRETNSLMTALMPLADMARTVRHARPQEEAASQLTACVDSFKAPAEDHGLKQAAKFARMLENCNFGIAAAWKHRISTGPLEGVNARAKLIKRIACGCEDFDCFALKLNGKGRNPLMLSGKWTATIKPRICRTDLGQERESRFFFN